MLYGLIDNSGFGFQSVFCSVVESISEFNQHYFWLQCDLLVRIINERKIQRKVDLMIFQSSEESQRNRVLTTKKFKKKFNMIFESFRL